MYVGLVRMRRHQSHITTIIFLMLVKKGKNIF